MKHGIFFFAVTQVNPTVNGSNLVEALILIAVGLSRVFISSWSVFMVCLWQLVLHFHYPAALAQPACLRCLCAAQKQL